MMMRKIRPSQNKDAVKRIGIFSWSVIGFLLIAALFLCGIPYKDSCNTPFYCNGYCIPYFATDASTK